MWNHLDLHCPTFDVVQYLPQDGCQIESLQDFVTVLTKTANVLTTGNLLWKETNVFQNIQVKYKRIHRCDKCLIFLRRVGHCLRKIVLLNLSNDYLNLAERFLCGLRDTSVCTVLPSRQQVEYILIRTQSAAKLLCQAIQYSRHTFCFLIQKLKVGHLILDLITAASVTARLYVVLNSTLVQLCEMYQKVLTWCHKLKEGTHKWAKEIHLPMDLEKWLVHSETEKTKCESHPTLKENMCAGNGDNKQGAPSFVAGDYADCGEVLPRKKQTLTPQQKKTLKKLLSVSSLNKLKTMWQDILKQDLPVTLTAKKEKVICKFFALVQKRFEKQEKKNRRWKELCRQTLHNPCFSINTARKMIAKYVGFTQDQINVCQNKIIS